MIELVYNVSDIFNSRDQNGCLTQYECDSYHIPSYQRGYKWSSKKNGAVDILLTDLWAAFEKNNTGEVGEYYLQYITVKKIALQKGESELKSLEVIDGQQRLTTLSIFISVLSNNLNIPNLSEHKLDYAIRYNFFENYIYSRTNLDLIDKSNWDEFLSKNTDLDKQDIFYLFSACKKSFLFFETKKTQINEFYNYLINNVKIIINSVESHISSENVFKNLNSNKVPLTETELIKGLLITKVGRRNSKNQKSQHFKEILEIRNNLGRHWDEISRWSNRPEIKSFFFNGKEGMLQLLILLASFLDNKIEILNNNDKKNNLFGFYHEYPDLDKVYNKLILIQEILNDWFNEDKIYNLLGFLRFTKGNSNNNLKFLIACLNCNDKDKLEEFLYKELHKLLPNNNIENLVYGEDDYQIHAILLYLNIFKEGLEQRFNFYEFIDNNWSLEHVFPQKPEGKNNKLNQNQMQAVKDMLKDNMTVDLENILSKEERSEVEKDIYYQALQSSRLLNSIGNMCLLSSPDNSSNGCMFFNEKRHNILELIRKGSFVPKHTFDVFAKMIHGMKDDNLSVWSILDIEAHTIHISNQLKKLLKD